MGDLTIEKPWPFPQTLEKPTVVMEKRRKKGAAVAARSDP
jgi:hypothetical protein